MKRIIYCLLLLPLLCSCEVLTLPLTIVGLPVVYGAGYAICALRAGWVDVSKHEEHSTLIGNSYILQQDLLLCIDNRLVREKIGKYILNVPCKKDEETQKYSDVIVSGTKITVKRIIEYRSPDFENGIGSRTCYLAKIENNPDNSTPLSRTLFE